MYKWKLVFVLMASLFLCGCASNEYYKDRAAASARDFLFSKIKYMSPENEAYIKYTYPDILVSPISPTENSNQVCFAWNLPSPKVTILVYGASKGNLRAWFPVRVLFKEYTEQEMKSEHGIKLKERKKMGKEWKVPKRRSS